MDAKDSPQLSCPPRDLGPTGAKDSTQISTVIVRFKSGFSVPAPAIYGARLNAGRKVLLSCRSVSGPAKPR
jgi:hypothetical protein